MTLTLTQKVQKCFDKKKYIDDPMLWPCIFRGRRTYEKVYLAFKETSAYVVPHRQALHVRVIKTSSISKIR